MIISPDLENVIIFLLDIGLDVNVTQQVHGKCFIPNVKTELGKISVCAKTHPGDLLHEAGHVATAPSFLRNNLSGEFDNSFADLYDYGDWMLYWNDASAIAWSYMAGVHIGIDSTLAIENGIYQKPIDVRCLDHSFKLGVGNQYTVNLYYLGMLNSKCDLKPNKWLNI